MMHRASSQMTIRVKRRTALRNGSNDSDRAPKTEPFAASNLGNYNEALRVTLVAAFDAF